MKNNQCNLVRALQGSLSDFARVCTRYNKNSAVDKLGAVDVTYANTKLVLADYGNNVSQFSVLSFTLKIMQIVPVDHDAMTTDTLSKMVADVTDCIAQGDDTFKIVNSAADALKHSGLNSSYVYVLRDIANCVADASSAVGSPVTKIQYMATATFGGQAVGMVFVYAGSVVVLQFTD